ncbi:MAG: hypothetical protein HRU40_14115 [Saprospiraceae bacterium]|nr:hypothetical protein [Saprospiraceae bacterium]
MKRISRLKEKIHCEKEKQNDWEERQHNLTGYCYSIKGTHKKWVTE